MNIKRLLYKNLLFVVIIIFAAAVRIWQLEEMPSGFHRDEVLNSYIGTYVLKNGYDIYGNFLPLLYVDKYGDYPPVLPMYVSGISNLILGDSVFAARLPIALIGILLLIPIFFLAKMLFNDKRIAIFTAFLVAILPWHIVLSRATSEGIVGLTIITWGFLHLFQFIKNQKPVFFLFACILFFLTYFLYPSYRILIPLALLPLPFLFHFTKNNKLFIIAAVIFFFLTTAFISSTDWGRGRFEQTSMFGEQSGEGIKQTISMLAQEEGPNKIREVKTFHNKYVLYTREFFSQYLTYFSPQYLFLKGGLPYRYTVPDDGLIYITLIPFLLVSLVFLYLFKSKTGVYILYLLIISPIPASLTLDDVPNVHRTLFMVLPLVLLISFGFVQLLDVFKKSWIRKGIFCGVIFIIAIELIYFLHMYYHHANVVKSFDRGDSNKELIHYVIDQRKNYDTVYIPVHDAFPFYYLFFTHNYDPTIPKKIQKELLIWHIDNITFTDTYCPAKDVLKTIPNKKVLVIERVECPIDGRFIQISAFTRHDSTTSYRIFVPKKA